MGRTDDGEGEVLPVENKHLLLRTHHVLAQLPQMVTARRGRGSRDRPKHQSSQLSGTRSGRRSGELAHEVDGQRELDRSLNDQEDMEPRVVGGMREEWISREVYVPLAERYEEVERR